MTLHEGVYYGEVPRDLIREIMNEPEQPEQPQQPQQPQSSGQSTRSPIPSPQTHPASGSASSPGLYQTDTQNFAGNIIRSGSAMYQMYRSLDDPNARDSDEEILDYCQRNHRPIC